MNSNFYTMSVQTVLIGYKKFYTVVGEFINLIKTTFDFNYEFYQAVKGMDTLLNMEKRKAVN